MIKYFLLFLLIISNVSAQDMVNYSGKVPTPIGVVQPDIKKSHWLLWSTQNFDVFTLDKQSAKYFHENIESIKTWIYNRWGIKDQDFSTKSVLCIVRDADELKKLFNLDQPHVQVQSQENQRLVVGWLIFNSSEPIIPAITLICLKQLEYQVPLWAFRGIAILNGGTLQIRSVMLNLSKKDKFACSELMAMTQKEWRSKDSSQRALFDSQAAALCLLIRKEFGQYLFLKSLVDDPIQVLKFKNKEHFDKNYERYIFYLNDDLSKGRTPESYFLIEGIRR